MKSSTQYAFSKPTPQQHGPLRVARVGQPAKHPRVKQERLPTYRALSLKRQTRTCDVLPQSWEAYTYTWMEKNNTCLTRV